MPYTDDISDLTSDQVLLKQEAHRFAVEVLRPTGAALDDLPPDQVIASGSPLWDAFKKAYRAGHHLRGFPPELGGASLGPLESHLVGEEFGWGNSGLSISLGVASMPFRFAAMSGHPDLMRELVMPFVEDTEGRYIGCWGATEPNHGSDLIMGGDSPDNHLDCSAFRDGDEWVIRGQKSSWVSNGTIATHTLAFLNVKPELGMQGIGVAVVPLNLPGVSKGPPTNKLGQRPLNQGEIFFDDVRIPAHYMLAEPPFTAGGLDNTLAGANAGMSSTFSGVARAAFEEALTYTQARIQGGVPISSHQLVQKRLFDMFMRVNASRALSRKANQRLQSGLPTVHYSMAAKVFATRTAFDVASDASELCGAMGMVKGVLVEALMRDARAALIEDGSNDTLSIAGAQHLLG
jgi:alkylation response protein AidB-like acyl-CoA dehydrogenase